MSSHHFVKEKQEPAIFIHSEEDIDEELLGQLLEWCPYVIADEHILYYISHNPIKIDLVIQRDLSDEEINTWISNQPNISVLKLIPDDDKLEHVIRYLENENHEALSVIACKEQSIKNLLNIAFTINLIHYHKEYKEFYIDNHFNKWKVAGSIFKIGQENPSVINLIKDEDIWRVVQDGIVEIRTHTKALIKEYNIGS